MMKLQDLMTKVELQVKKAREDFNRAKYRACRNHLEDLYESLDDQYGLEGITTCESDGPSNGS